MSSALTNGANCISLMNCTPRIPQDTGTQTRMRTASRKARTKGCWTRKDCGNGSSARRTSWAMGLSQLSRTKSTPFDRVTIADLECEKAVVQHIKKRYPYHNIIGEEGKYLRTDSPYVWAIDPVDGTNNYSKGYPFFCVSIGLAFK